jgi:hypothetical protein
MGLSQLEEVQPLQEQFRWTNASGTGTNNAANTAAGRYRIDGILVTNTDTIAHVIRYYYATGGQVRLIGSVNVPAGQGTGGTPPVDCLPALIGTSQWQMVLPVGDLILISFEVAIVSPYLVDMVFFGGIV